MWERTLGGLPCGNRIASRVSPLLRGLSSLGIFIAVLDGFDV
jgi:hypothetical protein